VRGREYNGKYYNTLDAWKVQGEVVPPAQSILDSIINNETDDLPF
jgi:hypothetical protein